MESAVSVGELVQSIEELKKKTAKESGALPPKSSGASSGPPNDLIRQAPVARATVSEEDVRAQWPRFLAEVRQRRISLGSSIEGSRVSGVKGNVILIGCADRFVVDSFKRYKQELQEILQVILGARVHLETEIDGQATRPSPLPVAEVTQQERSVEEHPVVRALIRELGAEPLDR
jgi:hypothetical protein